MNQLLSIVSNLISQKKEGQYWDFKISYHNNNAALLHDILCLANAEHNGDRFIIFGVKDQGSEVRFGERLLSQDLNRRNQQQLIDFLQSKLFAGSIIPEISLESILYNGELLDILVIKDLPNKPYYLTEDYSVGKKIVRANYIYTRKGDTNTPINKSADLPDIEKMWKERFGFNLSVKERFIKLLKEPQEWHKNIGNSRTCFNKFHSEYKIELSDLVKFHSKEAYCYFYPNHTSYLGQATFYHGNTAVEQIEYITCDEMRIYLPTPEICYLKHENINEWFFYYIKESWKGTFLGFLTDSSYSFSSGRIGEAPFIVFENNNDFEQFQTVASLNLDIIKNFLPSNMAQIAQQAKLKEKDQLVIEPIFLDQISQFYNSWRENRTRV